MKTQGLIPIIDCGHGYMIAGQYQTAGKRSPNWDKGVLYEGVSNKDFGWAIMQELNSRNIPYYASNPELKDISLRSRVNRADAIYKSNPSTYLLSIHSNAGGGTGIEGFTSKGDTPSDPICEEFLKDIESNFPKLKPRFDWFDGDRDKEADYFILKNTLGPALLLELLFMDKKEDYDLLWDESFRASMVCTICDTIQRLYNGKS